MDNINECKGCGVNFLMKSRVELKVFILIRRLYVACPLCGYNSPIIIDKNGEVHLADNND